MFFGGAGKPEGSVSRSRGPQFRRARELPRSRAREKRGRTGNCNSDAISGWRSGLKRLRTPGVISGLAVLVRPDRKTGRVHSPARSEVLREVRGPVSCFASCCSLGQGKTDCRGYQSTRAPATGSGKFLLTRSRGSIELSAKKSVQEGQLRVQFSQGKRRKSQNAVTQSREFPATA